MRMFVCIFMSAIVCTRLHMRMFVCSSVRSGCKWVCAYACACVYVWVESACGSVSVCECFEYDVFGALRAYLVVLHMPLIIITTHTRSLLYESCADGAIST